MKINGEALRAIRERSELTGTELADKVGCSFGMLYSLERGDRGKGASATLAKRIAKELKVPLVAILAEPADEEDVA